MYVSYILSAFDYIFALISNIQGVATEIQITEKRKPRETRKNEELFCFKAILKDKNIQINY